MICSAQRRLSSSDLLKDAEFLPSLKGDAKFAFLKTLSVLSVPEKQSVAYGLYVLEAFAAGVPVVEPSSGVFPELLKITGGGVLFEPNHIAALAAAIEKLLLEPDCARKLGKEGRDAVFEKFNIEQTAEEMIRIYGEIAQ